MYLAAKDYQDSNGINMRILHRIFYEYVGRHLPAAAFPVVGSWCRWLRYINVRALALECGRFVNCEHGASVEWRGGVRIGIKSGIGIHASIQSPITIGAYVNMGPEVIVYRRHGHGFSRTDIPMQRQDDLASSELRICDDVWIGRRAIILQNCRRVGKGAIIGAGAVVTKDVPDYAIVAGNPARVVRLRTLTHDPTGEAKLTLPSGVLE